MTTIKFFYRQTSIIRKAIKRKKRGTTMSHLNDLWKPAKVAAIALVEYRAV